MWSQVSTIPSTRERTELKQLCVNRCNSQHTVSGTMTSRRKRVRDLSTIYRPPNAVISLVNNRATKVHTTLHRNDTDETMVCPVFIRLTDTQVFNSTQIPLFQKDTNESPCGTKYVMARRNWCKVELNTQTGELVFDIRIEKEKGCGVTKG